RVKATASDLNAQFTYLLELRERLSGIAEAVVTSRAVRRQLNDFRERAGSLERFARLKLAAADLERQLNDAEESLTPPRARTMADHFNYPAKLDNRISLLIGIVENADAAPTKQSYDVGRELQARSDAQLARLHKLLTSDLDAFNAMARNRRVAPIEVPVVANP